MSEQTKPRPWVAGLILLVVGTAMLVATAIAGEHLSWAHLIAGFAEAVIIAGLLVLFVEPTLRKKFVSEIVGDLAPHIYHFRFPNDVVDALKKVVTPPLVRKNMVIRFALTKRADGLVDADVDWEWDLFNFGDEPYPYESNCAFDDRDGVDPSTVAATISADGHPPVATKGGEFKARSRWRKTAASKSEAGTVSAYTTTQRLLRPQKREATDRAGRVVWNYKMVGKPADFRDTLIFVNITAGVEVRANRVDGLQFVCQLPEAGGSMWTTSDVFLPGQGITFGWHPSKAPPAPVSDESDVDPGIIPITSGG